MTDVLLALAVITVVWIVLCVVAVLFVRARLRRQNRVVRRTPSPAPVRWLWSPSTPARLHRRLQAALWTVDPDAPGAPLPQAPLTDDLRLGLARHATSLDEHLAAARRAPRSYRRVVYREADGHVRTIEQLSADLEGRAAAPPRSSVPPWVLALPPRSPVSEQQPPSLAELQELIRHLQAARAEVC